ncbi:MAG TPA: hypothetical protein VMY77_11820 [Chitinophagaceae bacterium]|nr:hypothetical protein [Chitinophagaceae bacterium]
MTQIEHINEIARTLDIPEEHMIIFRLGYFQGRIDQIEVQKKQVDVVINSYSSNIKIAENVTN